MNPTQPGSFQYIALDAIRPSATNPRKNFDPAALEELSQSIRESKGVAVAILVRPVDVYAVQSKGTFVRYAVVKARKVVSMGAASWPKGVDPRMRTFDEGTEEENQAAAEAYVAEANALNDGAEYEIVFGERRWLAAKAAGLTEIRAEVRDLTDAEAMDLQLVENLQRADLHPVEEAEGYRALMATGASVEDVAKKAGKTTPHVQKLLKLLLLELPVKTLFHAGHLTLGHALLLARLTPADQDRAVRDLLGANHLPKKEDMVAYVNREIKSNEKSTHRLIRSTEGELRYWIESRILLSLAKVPWSLGDADLVPEAGACTTCPKRTGTNAALFADMTAKEDQCLDAVCFGAKHKALQTTKLKEAAEAGKPLLKLATKSGHKKIEGEPSPKVTLKQGQWIKAAPGSCDHTQKGMLTEDPGTYDNDLRKYKAGDTIVVCANQACTVHQHKVDAPTPAAVIGGVKASAEDREQAKKLRREVWVSRETAIRRVIYAEMFEKVTPASMFEVCIMRLFGDEGIGSEGINAALEHLSVKVKTRGEWDNTPKIDAIGENIIGVGIPKLAAVAFEIIAADYMAIQSWHDQDDEKEQREQLWAMAESLGVDANAILKAFEKEEEAAQKLAAEQAKAKPESGTGEEGLVHSGRKPNKSNGHQAGENWHTD